MLYDFKLWIVNYQEAQIEKTKKRKCCILERQQKKRDIFYLRYNGVNGVWRVSDLERGLFSDDSGERTHSSHKLQLGYFFFIFFKQALAHLLTSPPFACLITVSGRWIAIAGITGDLNKMYVFASVLLCSVYLEIKDTWLTDVGVL